MVVDRRTSNPVPRSANAHRRSLVTSILSLATIAISAIGLTSYQVVRGLILNNLTQQALSEVRESGEEIDRWLSNRVTEIKGLASSPQVRSLDWAAAEPYLKAEVNRLKDYESLLFALPDGTFYSSKVGGRATANIRDRPYFRTALAGQPTVSDPIIGRTTGNMLVAIAVPIAPPDATPSGVFVGTIPVDRVTTIVSKRRYGTGSYAFALNSRGVAIAHPNRHIIDTPEHRAPSFLEPDNPFSTIAYRMIDHQQGIERVIVNGAWQYIAFVPLNGANWSIALVIPSKTIESQLRPLDLLAAMVGVLMVVALVGLWRQVEFYEQARIRAAQEALQNRLTNRIRESLELQTIVQTTLSELTSLGELKQVYFGWYEPESNRFGLFCGSAQAVGQEQWFQPESNAPLRSQFQQEKTVRLVPEAPGAMSDAIVLSAHGYLALEIPAQDGRSGYLVGVNQSPLSLETRELLRAVADQLAIAINQSHLYSQTQAQVVLLNETLLQLQRAQAHLVQSEKMSSLGQLVAGVAHEINNPVNFIYGNLTYANTYTRDLLELLELYQHAVQPTPDIQDKIEAIDLEFLSVDLPKLLSSMQMGTERIREIVQSLRVFSRLDEAEYKTVDVHLGIDSTLMILQNQIKANAAQSGIQVIKHYGNLPSIECYAGQLNQVFMNLLSNAIDALEVDRIDSTAAQSQPTITIRTDLKDDWALISIQDTGIGMTEDIQKRLFDPFFTTKAVGKGTGMGLAISYQIVTEKHKGNLHCRSTRGQGTEFLIEIPIRQTAIAELQPCG